jgi:hypothetical protein
LNKFYLWSLNNLRCLNFKVWNDLFVFNHYNVGRNLNFFDLFDGFYLLDRFNFFLDLSASFSLSRV